MELLRPGEADTVNGFRYDLGLDWEPYCVWFDGQVAERPDGSASTHALVGRVNDMGLRERCIAVWAVHRAYRRDGAGFDAAVDSCEEVIDGLDRIRREAEIIARRLDVPPSLFEELL